MREVLDHLCRNPGILGGLVTTPDGMVVLSHLGSGLDEDVAAALVSSLISQTVGLMKQCGKSRLDQLELRSSRGKIVVSDLGNSYLVVVTDRNLDLKQGLIEIKSASNALRRIGRINVNVG